MDNAVNNR